MIRLNEDALICDFAETYQIFDYKRLPAKLAAVFAVGLRDDSRIKMEMAGLKVKPEMIMQAVMIDRLSLLAWLQTKDAIKNRNRPKPILKGLVDSHSDVSAYNSGEDFETERKRILQVLGGEYGN